MSHDEASQGLASIGMRRPSFEIVPRGVTAVTKSRLSFVPCPKFDPREHPKIQVGYRQVGPDVTRLLLSSSPDLFDIMEILVNRGSIGEDFQISCTMALEWQP